MDIKLLKEIVRWIEKVAEDKICLPEFSANIIPNTERPIPTVDEVISNMKWGIGQIEHPPYICLYRAVCGWQTAFHVWDLDGFYDVHCTGNGPYGHTKKGYTMAAREGTQWANAEQVEFRACPFITLKEEEKKRKKRKL